MLTVVSLDNYFSTGNGIICLGAYGESKQSLKMDPEICKSISKLVGKLSTSGKKIVDAKGVKDLMYYAG